MTQGFGNSQGAAPGGARPAEVETMVPDLLEVVLQQGASDLHLTAGSPPVIRAS